MPNVLIRDLDPQIHAVLASRAETRGQSLQQYLTAELTRLASQLTLTELFAATSRGDAGTTIPPASIVQAIHDGRAER